MENEKKLKCDTNCCVRNLVLLYEGEEFRNYLEHHVANYKLHKRDVSITLQEVHSSSSSLSNVFEYNNTSKGNSLLEHVNGVTDTGSSLLPSWDGVVFPAHMTGALQESNRLWDWNDYLLQQQNSEHDKHDSKVNIEWMDIQPFFRSQAQQVNKKSTEGASSLFLGTSSNARNTDGVTRRTLYVPLDGDVISLYYRKDLFEKNQILVPRTWDSYRDVATFFHGKPWGPNNTTLAGSCVARKTSKSSDNSNNMYAYWASLVLSTMTQTQGTSSGFLLDPETLEPILGDAMEETLRILAQELALSEGNDHEVNDNSNNDDLNDLRWRLNEGSCAMTFTLANELTTAMNDDYKNLNNIGVAPTPGSKFVLNRTSGHLENCTPELCPYGTYYDDIGIVNRPSYAAFGGWVGGVSNDSTSSKQQDMVDFFSYISNPGQSLSDVLPNERSHFVSPYRYSHVAASNWVGAGFDEVTASQYTETIKEVNSENIVSEIRIPPGTAIREIIDQEVNSYLSATNGYENVFLELFSASSRDAALRSEITSNMDRRIRDAVTSLDTQTVISNYQSSLSFPERYEDVSMNYININYRDTGWGAAALICFSSIAVVFWILWNRKKTAMQAFQPILLIQSAVGFFFMGATLVPLGFDDSLFSKEILDITCMATPWIYVFGYTVFFSSVYSKIQVCTEIYKNPGKYERIMVRPIDSLKLFGKLFVLNGILLGLWTHIDPLKWSRIEKTNGIIFPDGTVESYGGCMSNRFEYAGFAIGLFVLNLICTFVAMLQALRCRLLVLEYHQMQWLQLCIVPFFEAWIVGGPVIIILHEQPSAQYVAFLMTIASSSIASAFAIFAPKEWYIRKNNILVNESGPETPPTPSPAGVRVLKHPKLESQKHVANLQRRLVRYTASNTELEIDIRVLREKFGLLTKKEKLALVGGMFARERSLSQNFRMSTTMLEVDEPSISDTRDSDTLAMAWHDEKYNNNQIDTVITKNSTHARVSELSIGIDDLKRFRAEAGYSEDDSIGKFAGKSVRSIVELIDYASVNSFAISEETRPINRRQQITSPQAQINDLVEDDGAPMKHTGDSAEVMVHPLGSSHVTEVKEKEGNTHTHGVFDEMEDLNQMIESDNIRDLHSETMMMAEEFKLSSSFLEDPPDLQPDDSERVREDLNLMIESDNIRDLKSETMMMAEEFKLRLSLLESLSDLQPGISERVGDKLKDDGIHTLDVSNATSTSTSTAITEYGSKGFTLPPDGSLSQSNRDCPESMVISSAGESSGGDVLSSEGTCAKNSEGYSRQQHAGEPSGDCRSPLIPNNDIVFDKAEGGTNLNAFNPLVPIQDGRPKTPTTESGTILSPRSSISSKSPMASVSSGLHSQVNTSQSSNNSKYNSISINGWKPTGVMGTLLADLSDSTSTSSRAESMTDSIASLEVISNQSHSKVRIGKDIEKLLNRHGFNAGKAAAERYEDCATDEKNESRATKISTTRQKKRELEARKLSFQSSSSSS